MANENIGLRQASWHLDLGSGHRVEADFDVPGRFWIAFGPAMDKISVWMKGVAGHDIRIEISRHGDGLVVQLDRGELRPEWWTEAEAPRLSLRIDGERRVVTVAAEGGGESDGLRILEQHLPEP